VRERVSAEVPEARTEFVQVLQDVLNDLAGTPRPLEIKLFGDDYATLRTLAERVAAHVRDVPGVVDAYEGFEAPAPELRFRVDRAAAARLGKSAEDVAVDLDRALHGTVAAVFLRPDRPVGVRVRYPDSVRFDPARLPDLPLVANDGTLTRIAA